MNRTSSSSAKAKSSLTVALIGNPNTGKSTIFSALCGLPTRIGNYPGVTVEKKIGQYNDEIGPVSIVDLPGTYSLAARTLDEQVSVDLLLGRVDEIPTLDAIVVIVDATNIERNLYLCSQILDLKLPVVLVLNMWDRVAREGITLDLEKLAERLPVKIVTTSAQKRTGIDELKQAIRKVAGERVTQRPRLLPSAFYDECEQLRSWLGSQSSSPPEFLAERMLLDSTSQLPPQWPGAKSDELQKRLVEARQRLSANGCRIPAVETQVRYAWIREQIGDILERPTEERSTISDRIDKLLTHRWWGLIAFAAIMFLVFQSIYSWAEPAMGLVESGQETIGSYISSLLPPGTLRSLLVDGVVAGVGSVLVFLPQILLLFLFIGVLEDCGYMARAAFVMDRLMTRLGLSGKSFVPLMSSFACAVPGIMATRVIENRRDRLVTILVAPLMSCSARLPVYLLMIGAFIPETTYAGGWIGLQGIVLLGMQSLGALIAIPIAWLLKQTIFQGETPPFVMELPSYKLPSFRVVLFRVWERGQAFVTRAGTLIFCTAILVWAAGYFPSDRTRIHELTAELEPLQASLQEKIDALPADVRETESETLLASNPRISELETQINTLGGVAIENSFLGYAGKAIEPTVRPLGWDWKIGVGVIASFPAREVIIATLGTIYSLGGNTTEESSGLKDALKRERWPNGDPVYTMPVALSIMVFFALCAQCAATLMTIRRETNSWRWPVFSFVYMTMLAYLGALLTYQIGSFLTGQ